MITSDRRDEIAAQLILLHAFDVEPLTISEMYGSLDDEDVEAVADRIAKAEVHIYWLDD